jgi:guanosine-3',5'-bis(diphosphate) 3'-pyrophosphohydrolase
VEVGFLLAGVGEVQDRDTLIAAILHDAIEDTPSSLDEITKLFGSRVSQLVEALSDDKSLPKSERKRLVLAHLAHAEDAVKLIKFRPPDIG